MSRPVRSRRGSAYLLVLGVAMLLTVAGVASVLAVRAQRNAAVATIDAAEARLCAQAGIEYALLCIEKEPAWRTARAEGEWFTDMALGTGSFTIEVNDLGPSADLALSSASDPILITSTGVKGNARHKVQVRMAAGSGGGTDPLNCLQVCLQSQGNITFSSATVSSTGIIGGNGNATAVSSMVAAQVQVSGTVSGGNFSPFPTGGVEARDMPSSNVFTTYSGAGTAILYGTISSGTIEEVLLSPGVNPYGGHLTNANGIYVIDCGGRAITIQNCRIVGTLVLLDVGAGSQITGQIRMEPAVEGQPTLLVEGSMSVAVNGDLDLNEPQWGVNFNPPHTPLDGVSNETAYETHPSLLKGLFYVSGDLSTSLKPAIDGCLVVGGTCTAAGQLALTYDPIFFTSPPQGFTTGTGGPLEIVAGSYAQVVD